MHWGTVPTPTFITEKYCSLIVDCSWMSETTILVSVTSFMLGTMGLDVFTLILLLLVVIIIVVIIMVLTPRWRIQFRNTASHMQPEHSREGYKLAYLPCPDVGKEHNKTHFDPFIVQDGEIVARFPCSHVKKEQVNDKTLSTEFDQFIVHKVISVFHRQRQEGYQFAVLLITAESNLLMNTMDDIEFHPCDPQHGTPLVNNEYPDFPPINDRVNYIVTRPHEKKHCEMIMLRQAHDLWRDYGRMVSRTSVRQSRGRPCIILYSWFLPCSSCTDKILSYYSVFKQIFKNSLPPMIVVFTANLHKKKKSNNRKNIERMKQAGIIVKKVKYPHRLLPA